MKIWQKLFSGIGIAAVLLIVVLFPREEKECCLCSSFRCHAPCLIDLETGELVELDLYFPHPDKAAELAYTQPEMDTFSFVGLGNVTGTKETGSKIIKIDVPISEKTTNPALCKSCKKQLDGLLWDRYVLSDLYSFENKALISIENGMCTTLRCYTITAQKESDIIKVTIEGNFE